MASILEQVQDKYELVSKIREGGMGAIFLVRHKLLGEQRVVKIMRPQLEGDQEFRARFVREAQTLIRLRHPHIAQLYDFFADETCNAAMVMEYIPGIDLRELLRRFGPPSLGLTVEIAIQALQAIGFLHRRQMVHRDIAPDNLMLSRDADGKALVKLIDLGIVKMLEEAATGLTGTGMFLGKVRYASPEQFQSAEGSKVDQRSDLYSFGIVFYELLTGRLPVSGDTASALIAAHLYHPPLGFDVTDSQGRVPLELRQLVLQLLAKKPSERPATAEIVQKQLRDLQARYPCSPEELEKLIPMKSEELPGLSAGPFPTSSPSQASPQTTTPTSPMSATVPTLPLSTTTPTLPGAATPTPAPSSPVTPPLAAPITKRGWKGLWLASFALLGVLLAGFFLARPYFLRRRPLSPSPTGVLVLHALPWAHVQSIISTNGDKLPLPNDPVTPLALSLPPGSYTVVLTDPTGKNNLSTNVQVTAGVTSRVVVPINGFTPEEFLEKLGWR